MKATSTTHAGWNVFDAEQGKRMERVIEIDTDALTVSYTDKPIQTRGNEIVSHTRKVERIDVLPGQKLFLVNSRPRQLAAALKNEKTGG